MTTNTKIACELCGAMIHSVEAHVKQAHENITLAGYQAMYPDAPIVSEAFKKALAEKQAAMATPAPAVAVAHAATATVTALPTAPFKKAAHEVFEIDTLRSGSSGKPIGITMFPDHAYRDMVPARDDAFIFDIENLKYALLGFELNYPTYIWGHSGTGKTTLAKQICNRTNRPVIRVQHTINTEESHIIGQWTVVNGNTEFQLGPLAMAMKYGWVYIADEYDFAMAAVLAVYQPILEGDSLVIKDADPENRVIKPHPNFRFVATGNTNGTGDETGLYQGTQLQNAANYDRFLIVVEQRYLAPDIEAKAIRQKSGIKLEDAKKLVDIGNRVRAAYGNAEISSTVSPRALIGAANLGLKLASFKQGLKLAYVNKLSKVDQEAVDAIIQRVFGNGD